MFTRPKALVSVSLIGGILLAAPQYPNFSLPSSPRAAVSAIQFSSKKLSLYGKNVRLKSPSIDAAAYVGQKESYLAEKREEAIKIVRQQLDAGLSNNRDSLLLRLGQLLAEKYMEVSVKESEVFTALLAQQEKETKSKKDKPIRLDNTRSQRYLKDALGVFNTVEKEFPRHPKMDEVAFFIGFVELEQGNTRRAVRYLERVVQVYPKSRKFDEALVYLGDYYFDKHQLAQAMARYRVLAGRRSSDLHHYARYKIAWCQMNQQRPREGLNTLKKLVKDLEGNNEPSKFSLRNQTLKDMVAFFAEVEAVQEAVNFYEAEVGRAAAAENIKLIADMLRVKARDESAVRAYEKVLVFFGDTLEAPKAEIAIFEASLRLGHSRKAIDRFEKAMKKYSVADEWATSTKHDFAALNEVVSEMQRQAENAALFFHQSAQKSNNKTSYSLALSLYDAFIQTYPEHQSTKKLAFYRAEILFVQKKWAEAADAYLFVAKLPPKDKLSDEALYDALLSLDQVTNLADKIQRYTKDQQKTLDVTAEEIPEHEKKFLEIAQYYLTEYPQGERVVDVHFRMGAIYYRHKHFDAAQEIFRVIATRYPKHRTATTAAHIVLDIYNIQKAYAKLNAVAAEFAAISALGDGGFRKEVGVILEQVSFKEIEQFEKANNWAEAADAYFEFYRKSPQGQLAPDALYNSLVSHEKTGNVDKIAEITKLYLAKFPRTNHSKRVMLLSASLAEKTYDIETAQKVFEQYYKEYPSDPEATKALFNAAVFAELLEMNSKALELYDLYLNVGSVALREQRSIAISRAKLFERMNQWGRVAQIYRQLAQQAKSTEERLAYLGELSRRYEAKGRLREREVLLKEMVSLYDSHRKMGSGPGIPYVAEAKFREIQKSREKFDAIGLRFPPEDLVYLLKKRQRLLVSLTKAYDKVVEIGVPEWGVAALFEKSRCFANFVTAYRDVKIPARYKGEERAEAEKAIAEIDAQLVKPLENKASEIVKLCAERAAQFYVASEYSAKCLELAAGKKVAAPVGIVPRPNYWSTRWPGEEVAQR